MKTTSTIPSWIKLLKFVMKENLDTFAKTHLAMSILMALVWQGGDKEDIEIFISQATSCSLYSQYPPQHITWSAVQEWGKWGKEEVKLYTNKALWILRLERPGETVQSNCLRKLGPREVKWVIPIQLSSQSQNWDLHLSRQPIQGGHGHSLLHHDDCFLYFHSIHE